ncbi:hypothetical protein JHK82_033403 [Glycine max]|nr:hypothetical protein JHK85_034124 [Glycine max]KAG4985799.1 hypothetical protein JHK86_033490 [Glycine max]KAG5118983.1 hypothetical protein JHK82_033403 [Glycine max]KAG5139976.1 hypothetical protein JHK84_033744 [Glycine max]
MPPYRRVDSSTLRDFSLVDGSVSSASSLTPVIPRWKKCLCEDRESKQYRYHHNDGHTTEECVSLKDRIKELIQEEALNNYIYNPNNNKDGYRGRGRNRRGHKDS